MSKLEPVTLADVLDALNVFNKLHPSEGYEPWTEADFISVKHLPDFINTIHRAWFATPPTEPAPQAEPQTCSICGATEWPCGEIDCPGRYSKPLNDAPQTEPAVKDKS